MLACRASTATVDAEVIASLSDAVAPGGPAILLLGPSRSPACHLASEPINARAFSLFYGCEVK